MNKLKHITTQNPNGMESYLQNQVETHSAYPDLSSKTSSRIRGFCIVRERIQKTAISDSETFILRVWGLLHDVCL